MRTFWMALATTGMLAATGFPARDATAAIGRLRVATTSPTNADSSWYDAGGMLLLAGGMFGAAVGLRRRAPIAPMLRPD